MPTRASRRGRLLQVRLVDFYGNRFWEIVYTHEEAPEETRVAHIAMESAYDDPKPGDHVYVTYMQHRPVSMHKTD
jgi:hypothetical protein